MVVKKFLAAVWRLLRRHRQFTSVNILLLVMGLASCLAMTGYVLHELSLENMRAVGNGIPQAGDASTHRAAGPGLVERAAMETIPELEKAGRIAGKYDVALTVGNAAFTEKKMYFIEPTAFEVFTSPLVRGNPRRALAEPFSVVIDEVLASRYFGTQDPLGRTIRVEFDRPYAFKVTGVMKGLPTNTGLFVRMLASFSTLESLPDRELRLELKGWQAFELYYTLLQLRAAVETLTAEARVAG